MIAGCAVGGGAEALRDPGDQGARSVSPRFQDAGRRQAVTASGIRSSPAGIHTSAGRSRLARWESPSVSGRGWRRGLIPERLGSVGHVVSAVPVSCTGADRGVVTEAVENLATQGAPVCIGVRALGRVRVLLESHTLLQRASPLVLKAKKASGE